MMIKNLIFRAAFERLATDDISHADNICRAWRRSREEASPPPPPSLPLLLSSGGDILPHQSQSCSLLARQREAGGAVQATAAQFLSITI